MEGFWIYCELCQDKCQHDVLKSRTSTRRGFKFQGVVKCLVCEKVSSVDIKEKLPITLNLRISEDNETLKSTLVVDEGVLLKVGQKRPHPEGIVQITSLEIDNKRMKEIYSQENPIVWVKKITHSKVRFAIHDGESTHSFKQVVDSQEEYRVGMTLRLEGRLVKVQSIILLGGKSIKSANASNISRVTCYYTDRKNYDRRN